MERRKKLGVRGIWGFMIFTFIVWAPGEAGAITIWPNASYFNFSFNNPGARANGMGGAFIGVADDATAAYTNPAGLTVLTRPEVAGEYKYSNPAVLVRSYNGAGGYTENTYDDNSTSGISFLSFSYPFEKANITVFRHALVNFDISAQERYPTYIFNTNTQTNVTTYGVAVAYKIFDTLSIGGSIGFSELDFRSSFDQSPIYWRGSFQNTDSAENFTVGLFWNPFGGLNIGAVYRYGPKFSYVNQVLIQYHPGIPDLKEVQIYLRDDEYKIPDVYGIGVSYRFPFGLTLAADYNYIRYSQNEGSLYDLDGQDMTVPPFSLRWDDAYEIHAGLEWAFTVRDTPLAVRTGYAFKEAHGIYNNNIASYYAVPQGDDENIFSAGFGVVLFKNLQLDFSGAWGNLSTEYIASAVIRF